MGYPYPTQPNIILRERGDIYNHGYPKDIANAKFRYICVRFTPNTMEQTFNFGTKRVVKIGYTRYVSIPKTWLKNVGAKNSEITEIEITMDAHQNLILKPVHNVGEDQIHSANQNGPSPAPQMNPKAQEEA